MLREKFGIDKWYVFGGSWGSTLSLAYGITHPDRCLGLILRGIFLTRRKELEWFYQYGASEIFPDYWERYRDEIPEAERGDFITAYHKRLTSDDEADAPLGRPRVERLGRLDLKALSRQRPDGALGRRARGLGLARIECHYFMNNSFFPIRELPH